MKTKAFRPVIEINEETTGVDLWPGFMTAVKWFFGAIVILSVPLLCRYFYLLGVNDGLDQAINILNA